VVRNRIRNFFTGNPEFEFSNVLIDSYLTIAKGIDSKEKETLSKELKTVQRIFKLTPDHDEINAILDERFFSAQQITNIGKSSFIKKLKNKLGKRTAEKIFERAEHTAAAALKFLCGYSALLTRPHGTFYRNMRWM
jgi:hypothetical protein